MVVKRLLLFFSVLMVLSSCTKDDQDKVINDSSYDAFASVSIFNTIQQSDGIIVSVGHDKKERNMITPNNQVKFGDYFGYRNWFSGNWDLFIDNKQDGAVESMHDKLMLHNRKSYSLFVFRDQSLKQILTEDNIISPKSGMVKIRIANFLQGLDKANVKMGNTNEKPFNQIHFSGVTDFVEIDLKSVTSFKITSLNSQVEILYNLDMKLVDKGIYTVLLKGSLFNLEGAENQDYIGIIKQY